MYPKHSSQNIIGNPVHFKHVVSIRKRQNSSHLLIYILCCKLFHHKVMLKGVLIESKKVCGYQIYLRYKDKSGSYWKRF